MKTDIEIAHKVTLQPIEELGQSIGIAREDLETYGKYKAKVRPIQFKPEEAGQLILVTAVNPTPQGEGKTTMSIGLADGLGQIGEKVSLALREPSMGPVFGMKGGATGGGYAQVAPMVDINLHFTGDLHALTSANNLISAILDNHIYQGNEREIDPERVVWHRSMDVNDRTLREVEIGLGAKINGIERQDHFDITAASEIMAVLCLATGLEDLKNRLAKILVAYDRKGKPVLLEELGITGAVTILLKDALKPNLVQTLEGTPAFVHGGPFANIAHGCNSVVATQTALMVSDFVVTEAGFGSDLGAEKFLDIKARQLGKVPDLIVLVATVRALKYNGDQNLEKGFANLRQHIQNMQAYGLPILVAINQFSDDSDRDIQRLRELVEAEQVEVALSTAHADGGRGSIVLAEKAAKLVKESKEFVPLYDVKTSLEEKILTIVRDFYKGEGVVYTDQALVAVADIKKNGWEHLPICMAKTPYSFSDDPSLLGAPRGFTVTVRDCIPKLGAGFIVVMLGNIITMPGLPKQPAALAMDIDRAGNIVGLS